MFTRSLFAGPSVVLSRANAASGRARGVVVVAKNANVATGEQGMADARPTARRVGAAEHDRRSGEEGSGEHRRRRRGGTVVDDDEDVIPALTQTRGTRVGAEARRERDRLGGDGGVRRSHGDHSPPPGSAGGMRPPVSGRGAC